MRVVKAIFVESVTQTEKDMSPYLPQQGQMERVMNRSSEILWYQAITSLPNRFKFGINDSLEMLYTRQV